MAVGSLRKRYGFGGLLREECVAEGGMGRGMGWKGGCIGVANVGQCCCWG